MIYVGLDLSINSTGIAVIDNAGTLHVHRLTPKEYDKDNSGTKYDKLHRQAMGIAYAIIEHLMQYRFEDMTICIEEVAFGFTMRHSSSVYNLLFEGGTISALLKHVFDCNVFFVAPTTHKRTFTGKGNAKKEESVRVLLEHWQLQDCTDKLDDIADAVSVLSYFTNVFDAKL